MINKIDERKELRADLTTEIEFRVDADVLKASTIDVSESGLRLETVRPIRIALRYKEDVITKIYNAQLVWARETDGGYMEYGFKYVDDDDDEPKDPQPKT